MRLTNAFTHEARIFVTIREILSRLAAIIRAEFKGRLVILPCKVGDTVYSPRKNCILEQQVDYISMDESNICINVSFRCDYECDGCPHNNRLPTNAGDFYCVGEYGEYGFGIFEVNDFGKTVFPSREEAKAALKRGK